MREKSCFKFLEKKVELFFGQKRDLQEERKKGLFLTPKLAGEGDDVALNLRRGDGKPMTSFFLGN